MIFDLFCFVDEDHKSQPFDFLIDAEFVRMSLEEFLLAKGISAVLYSHNFIFVVFILFCGKLIKIGH